MPLRWNAISERVGFRFRGTALEFFQSCPGGACLLALTLLFPLACTSQPLPGPKVYPTSPPSLSIKVGEVLLSFDPPEREVFEARSRKGELPEAPQINKTISLTPAYDKTHTHILGNFFRTFLPETLVVTAEDGTPYQNNIDYTFNETDGTISNKDDRLKGRIKARATGAHQRLDLIQVNASGKPSVKKGISAWICPELPEPDPGHTALAGIYLAPWTSSRNPHYDKNPDVFTGATEYAITQHEIFPVDPAPPVPPIHPERLQNILTKLRAGGPVKIALMGDSITLGAESTRWWEDKYDANSKTWKGRVIHQLRQRFPKATIEVVEAYRGGVTIDYGLEKLPEVIAAKPDLVIASFGVNDASIHVGKKTPEAFGQALATLMDETKKSGGDFLFITPFPLIPWVKGNHSQRLQDDFLPVMKSTAHAHGAALADVNAEFPLMNKRGIPWWSQNHNWHNHPGDYGHQIYAETVLRCFPE
jgi:lysophospholipase L1-like esterase